MNKNANMSEEEFDNIERYVLDSMLPEEHAAFTQRLQADDELKSKVQEIKLLMLGVQEAILNDKLNTFHKEIPAGNKAENFRKNPYKKNWLIAASAVLIAVIGAWFFLNRTGEKEKIFTEYYKPDPGLISAMSTSDNYSFDRVMIDYKTGNYRSALTAWQGLLAAKPGNDTLNYFIGSAWLALEESDSAIVHFKKVFALPHSYFLKEADWYTGLALLKKGRKKEAIAFIEKADRPQKEALLLRLKK